MELRVKEITIPSKIEFNYDELKREIAEKVEKYTNLVYTDQDIKQAKADKATLNKVKKALNDERIRREKEYMKPFNEFKTEINEIIGIIDKPIAIIDKQVKEAEEQKKQEKALAIEEMFKELEKPDWLTLGVIYNSKWLNATFSIKSVTEEIESKIAQINNDLVTLSNLPEFGFEATEVYKSTLDINRAVNEGKRLAEIQKRKEEQERLKAEAEARAKAEAERLAEIKRQQQEEAEKRKEQENARAEEVKKPEPIETEAEERHCQEPETEGEWVSFEAFVTVEKARMMKKALDDLGIEIRPLSK